MTTTVLERLFGISGKIAVVTDKGRNSSIDIAPVLAAAGARVVVADHSPAHMQPVVDKIHSAGGEAIAIETDVEREASVIALFDQVKAAWGSPDIVVNCAAMTNNGPLTEFSEAAWDEVMAIDLKSVFFCMREAIKHMLAAGRGGRIVNVTTMGATHAVLNGNGAYSAARAGVAGLVRSAALDYARDRILVNCVLPGAVPGKVQFHPDMQTRLKTGQLTGPGTDAERRLPLGWGDPADIAAAVLYLAGPSGRYMTGQSITLDGGFLIS
ncbi:SDR family NAD(P)-dependent oxidoreductase [Paraburkholderia youngii]|uniref:SDR family oxidoreductase n=1 Tax=Paraburkholderia youngii TaxID=2782701 RepID=A0A7Y6K7L4_9BURK|nr:SDR family oxidoreductase [Paraburkholderia youngii]NUY04928.1 SDR family oxidoreductase [Paraburkholderia youngii]